MYPDQTTNNDTLQIVSDLHLPTLHPILHLARIHNYDSEHSHHVARLALQIFDALQPIHGLDLQARYWLLCGAVLHDIAKGRKSHHKVAQRIVMTAPFLPLDAESRRIVGQLARYHRKSPPSIRHRKFAALTLQHQEIVRRLTAILRIADALDSGHLGLVRSVRCTVVMGKVVVRCVLSARANSTYRANLKAKAVRKGTLYFEEVFKRQLAVKWGR